MPTPPTPLLRLVWIEVVGIAAADLAPDLGRAWRAALPEGTSADLHLEADGRRMLLLERWPSAALLAPWQASDAHQTLVAWLDGHGARTAASRWERVPPADDASS